MEEALRGNPDVRGILEGLHDWRSEKILIEQEYQGLDGLLDSTLRTAGE
jgi:hypothetical protein